MKEVISPASRHPILSATLLVLAFILTVPPLAESADPTPKPISGISGASARWGSGWLDLDAPMDFLKGDRLRLTIGGTAGKIFVRLLPKGDSPDESVGIIGGAITVPESRIVEVTLPAEHKQIIQISVNGGPNPWNRPLGGGNGPATLTAADLIRP